MDESSAYIAPSDTSVVKGKSSIYNHLRKREGYNAEESYYLKHREESSTTAKVKTPLINKQKSNTEELRQKLKKSFKNCNVTQTQLYLTFIVLLIFDGCTIFLCHTNNYYVGKIFAISVAAFHLFTMVLDMLIRITKKKGIVRSFLKFLTFVGRSILGPIIVLIFVQQFFSAVVSTDSLYYDHCPTNSNGCVRVNKQNQYRANNIEMRYPVTFKQQDIPLIISDWIYLSYDVEMEVSPTYEKMQSGDTEMYNKTTQFKFSQATWYGMIIDTLVTVQECTQVFKAQTVTLQSQTRLGFKDYGENYKISHSLYDYLDKNITEEGRKSFISCT